MSVLVVIPCLNEAQHLKGLISSLLTNPEVTKLVVADGGSDDGSQAIVEKLAEADTRVHLLHNPAKIQSAGINLAVSHFGGGMDWLLRVDAHCLYPPHYPQILMAAAHERETDAVVVPMLTRGIKGFQLAVAAAQNSVLGTGGSAHRSGREGCYVDHGHHALIRMELFQRVGGYCETMVCNEDAELDHRITQAGGRIWLEPKGLIVYMPRKTAATLARQYFKYGKGRADNLKRHRMRPRLRQMIPLVVPIALAMVPFSLLHPIFVAPALGWLLVCLVVGAAIGLRAGKGWPALAGAAAAIMHAAWAFGFLSGIFFSRNASEPKYGLFSER
ncbi:MAG: glycosyltransferase family 2 protein [Erythrobacter sp.]|nr:glycosyltransferase family 2 protein [Erythrobacter sp.]